MHDYTKEPIKSVLVPHLNITARFQDRQKMKYGHPTSQFKWHGQVHALPPLPSTPADWVPSLPRPMDGNDTLGICMLAAAAHQDNTWTGSNGSEYIFDLQALIAQYLKLAGGDNGLDEGTLITGWKAGLAGVAAANIIDALDIDTTNTTLVQQAIYYFGGVHFMLDVPDSWIATANTGDIWDVPATADQNNGHGVNWSGWRADGAYRLWTWGTYVWITPAGVKACDPSGFVVFSLRWFNPKTGYAPNGLHYTDLATIWTQFGGQPLPPSPFPPPGPTPPTPPVPPVPTSLTITTTTLPVGTVGQSYSGPLAATGGTIPYTWSATGLPAGLSVFDNVINGIPTSYGTGTPAFTVVDSSVPPQTVESNITLVVNNVPVPPSPIPTGNIITLTTALQPGSYPVGGVPSVNLTVDQLRSFLSPTVVAQLDAAGFSWQQLLQILTTILSLLGFLTPAPLPPTPTPGYKTLTWQQMLQLTYLVISDIAANKPIQVIFADIVTFFSTAS